MRVLIMLNRLSLWKGASDHVGAGGPVLRGRRVVTCMLLHIIPQWPKRRHSYISGEGHQSCFTHPCVLEHYGRKLRFKV